MKMKTCGLLTDYFYFYFFLIIFGCVGSSLLLSLVAASGDYSLLLCRLLIAVASPVGRARTIGTWASVVVARGLISCGSRALESRLSSCGARA